jgi:hypothetical protein
MIKSKINSLRYLIILIVALGFSSCEDDNKTLPKELTIQEKVALLESSEWLSKNGGNEPNVMYTFSKGKRFNSYKSNGVWHEGSTASSADYVAEENLLTMDFYFGHVYTYELKVLCNNTIIEFYKDGELNDTLYKRNSEYKTCL